MRKRQICNNNIFRGADIFVVPNNFSGGRFEGILQIYKSFLSPSQASPNRNEPFAKKNNKKNRQLPIETQYYQKNSRFLFLHFIKLSDPLQWLQCILILIFFNHQKDSARAKWRKKSNIVGRQLDINFSRPMKIVRREDIVAAAREICFASSFQRNVLCIQREICFANSFQNAPSSDQWIPVYERGLNPH